MKVFVCSIRDRATDTYGYPIFARALQQAIRSFSDQCNAKDGNNVAAHPEDFDLYLLGEFDDFTGGFECPAGRPTMIAVGKDLVQKVPV